MILVGRQSIYGRYGRRSRPVNQIPNWFAVRKSALSVNSFFEFQIGAPRTTLFETESAERSNLDSRLIVESL